MVILPIQTPMLQAGDDLAGILMGAADIQNGDIILVSSKAIATVEGAAVKLDSVKVDKEARELSEAFGRSAAYYQVVLDETKRMNGNIIRSAYGIVLTELRPDDMEKGTILVPNAGLDQSNIMEGYVIGWPKDPVRSLCNIRSAIGKNIAVIVTDSGLCPRRKGVTAFALATCGVDPFIDMKGTPDLFGHNLQMTEEAIADQLATAANFVMGNSNQSTPAVIVRDHGLTLGNYEGWVPGIQRELDIYHGVI